MLHRDFHSLVEKNWVSKNSIIGNLKHFQSSVLEWNRQVYGNIFDRKRILTWELTRVQQILELHDFEKLRKREGEI